MTQRVFSGAAGLPGASRGVILECFRTVASQENYEIMMQSLPITVVVIRTHCDPGSGRRRRLPRANLLNS